MDLKIPNIIKPIHLSEYAPEFGEAVIWVWVNPRRELRSSLTAIISGEGTDEQLSKTLSEIWSQGAEETRFTPEGILELANNCADSDPRLWSWLVMRSISLIGEHLGAKKKPLTTPPSS